MSENTASIEKLMTKQELEEKLDRTQLEINTYQAAAINKMLSGTSFRLDSYDNAKKIVSSMNKNTKKKPPRTSKPLEYVAGTPANLSDSGHNTPGSFSSFQMDDNAHSEFENSLGRRTSRRERKPANKVDLGYEEPKPIKGVKLSGASKEIFRKCEESLASLREQFLRLPEFASKAAKFDQEIKKLRDGHYRNTMMLGNSIRKFLNNLLSMANTSQLDSSKVASFIQQFEDSFSNLDNKTLFEEAKYDALLARKKSGSFGGKKKLSKQGSMSKVDLDKPMSDEEKKQLSRNIRNLTAPQLKGIIKIVKDMFPEKDGMLEFDIDVLPPRKWRELEEYVRQARQDTKKPPRVTTSSNPKNLNRQK